MLTKTDIKNFLTSAGIKPSDKVTMHTSLRAIGKIENGADGLIDGIKDYLCDGLFLVPTHTWANVGKDSPIFDVKATVPCIGTLPKVAAFRKDAFRTLHPTHSLAIFGRGAEEYGKGEEKSETPAPIGGCLSRLYEENGKVLLVGVGHERNTYLHSVDERFDIPNRLGREPYDVTIINHSGERIQGSMRPHFTSGLDAPCISDHFPNFKAAFEYVGAVKYAQLGNALVYVCDARKMTDTFKMLFDRAGYDICMPNEPVPERFYKS